MARWAILVMLSVSLLACAGAPDGTTSTAEPVLRLSSAERLAEETVEKWNPDWRPFVYSYTATCPANQPSRPEHRFICEVEISAHVEGFPTRIGVGYPATVEVLVEILNSAGQMLAEVVE